jgi:hypothetical protein
VEARLAAAGEGEPSRLQLLAVADDGGLLVSDRQQVVCVDPATHVR